jgi:hypothetical protein
METGNPTSTVNTLSSGATNTPNTLSTGLTNPLNTLSTGLTNQLTTLSTGLPNPLNSLSPGAKNTLNNLSSRASNALNTLSPGAMNQFNSISTSASSTFNSLSTSATNAVETMSIMEKIKIALVFIVLIASIFSIIFYFNDVSGIIQFILVIVVISTFSYLTYISLSYIFIPNQVKRVGPNELPLDIRTQVATSELLHALWSSKEGSSLIFYINPRVTDRTGYLHLTTSNEQTIITGNEYANVVQICGKQNLKLLIAPDAGRGMTLAPARFEIFIKGSDKPEYIDIPEFPMQRWSSVIIIKRGRKFNIFLNGKLIISHTCTAMPDFDRTAPLLVGDPRLTGKIALISLSPSALNANEVRDLLTNTVDTSGKPYMPVDLNSLYASLIPSLPENFWCPGGNCTTPKKPNPMEQWSSPYA